MNRSAVLLLAVSVLALASASEARQAPAQLLPPPTASAPQAALVSLMVDYEAWTASENPISAGQNGDRDALARMPDITPAGDARRRAALENFRVRLKGIDVAGLDENGKLNHAFIDRVTRDQLESIRFDQARLAFSSDDSWDGLISYLASTAPMGGKADAEAWLSRLEAAPKLYADATVNARRGLKSGFVQPRPIMDIVLTQARKAAAAAVETDTAITTLDRLRSRRGRPPSSATACARRSASS
jgi:uncharacterized protein (DUF885 family)